MRVPELAEALLEHANKRNAGAGVITAELSVLGGSPGVVCRVVHHANIPIVLLVPLTEFYKATHQNKHILVPLTLEGITAEYDRLATDAVDCEMFAE